MGNALTHPRGVARVLIRHFFERFFDNEALSPQADALTNIGPLLGLLATPGAFAILILLPLTLTGWGLVTFRYWFVAFSMIAMALVVVVKWDALFPDSRDYRILTPLPIRPSTMFLAKASALGLFLLLFLVDVNFFSSLMWPGVDTGRDSLHILGAHIAAVTASGVFGALAAAGIQGVLINTLGGSAYRRASMFIQTVLIAILIMLLFLTPFIAEDLHRLISLKHRLLYWFPGFWFVGLYEQLRPATRSVDLFRLGDLGKRALWISAAVFVLTYVPGYRRYARKVLEAPSASPAGPGAVRRLLERVLNAAVLRNPQQRAVFWFIGQTIARSMKHRLFVAVYAGFGAALGILAVLSGPAGLAKLPLTLSFVLVSGLRAAFNFPSELRANQAFRMCAEGGAAECHAALRKWIVLCALLPFFALFSPFLFMYVPARDALFCLTCDFALSLLLMEIMFFGFRKIPFTCSYFPGRVNLVGLSALYIFGFTTYSDVAARLEAWLLGYPLAAVLFVVSVLALWAGLAGWRSHGQQAEGVVDYEDSGDPAVRTLELASHSEGI